MFGTYLESKRREVQQNQKSSHGDVDDVDIAALRLRPDF